MSEDSSSNHKRTLRAKLSHPEVGDVGDGQLTFGYGCTCTFTPDGLVSKVRLTEQQMAEGLVAEAEDGKRWSLFGCKGWSHSLFIDFVAQGDLPAGKVQKFKIRYSDVSDWFFPQMRVDAKPGEHIGWTAMPAPLIAEVAQPGLNFKCESHYSAYLVRRGEDRNLHQHFEFHFTATQDRFSLVEVRDIARQFSQLLSLLLAHPCSIVSVEASPDGDYFGQLYYGVSKSPPAAAQTTDDPDYVGWRDFFSSKFEIDPHWDSVVNKFFQSKHRDVVWARLAGMQSFDSFWEYRILGYVTLLDGYVSKATKKGPRVLQPKKMTRLFNALAAVRPALTPAQATEVTNAVTTIFASRDSFESKFEEVIASLDPDVVHIIDFKSSDFVVIRDLRDDIAHGSEISNGSTDLTILLSIMHRVVLLLTYLFFLDVGLSTNVFLLCLDRTRNDLRWRADIDKVHLDRVLRPGRFLPVQPHEFDAIKARPRGLFTLCVVPDASGTFIYSHAYSQQLQDAISTRAGARSYQRLGLPAETVRDLGEAYLEDGDRIESVHSVVIVYASMLVA